MAGAVFFIVVQISKPREGLVFPGDQVGWPRGSTGVTPGNEPEFIMVRVYRDLGGKHTLQGMVKGPGSMEAEFIGDGEYIGFASGCAPPVSALTLGRPGKILQGPHSPVSGSQSARERAPWERHGVAPPWQVARPVGGCDTYHCNATRQYGRSSTAIGGWYTPR